MSLKSRPKIGKLLASSGSEDEGTEGGGQLGVNTNYAERYEKWRGKEELQKLKDRVGSMQEVSDSESSSESESEWNPEEEKQFFKTLSCLKKKDPKIYDEKQSFFKGKSNQVENGTHTGESSASGSKRDKKKPFLLKDHERIMVLDHDGLEPSEAGGSRPHESGSYYDELRDIKKDISAAVKDIDSDADDDNYDESDLLTKRVKSSGEVKEEEEDYRKWLKGQLNKLDNPSAKEDEKEMKFLKDYWNDPKLDDGEQFLRDYILNRKYVEGDKEYIPSYDEIIHDSDDEGLSGDERRVEEMETFENKYNFRFEEPDQEFIKKYPRTVNDSYRRTEVKRKTEREHLKERKKLEKEKKVSEIQRYKALKRKEILEKLEKLQEISGKANPDFQEADVEEDFDPEKHDRRMEQIFNDQYYCDEDAIEKPVFDYDEDIDDIEDFNNWVADPVNGEDEEEAVEETEKSVNKKKKKKKKNKPEPDTFDCDADFLNTSNKDGKESSSGKKGKKKSFFMETMERKKPTFDPATHKSFKDYFDEYYKLDFEDLIGDTPCRFKYRKVVPNSFGLTMDEILKAPDKELNQWASVKKACQYRSTEEEKYDVQAYEAKARDLNKKKRVLLSLYNEAQDEEQDEEKVETDQPKKKKKKKKRKGKSKTAETFVDETEADVTLDEESAAPPPKKKRKGSTTVAIVGKIPSASVPLEHDLNGAQESRKNNGKSKPNNNSKPKKKAEGKEPIPSKPLSLETNKKAKSRMHPKKSPGKFPKGVKQVDSLDADRLRAYGINPTKYEKRRKYKKV